MGRLSLAGHFCLWVSPEPAELGWKRLVGQIDRIESAMRHLLTFAISLWLGLNAVAADELKGKLVKSEANLVAVKDSAGQVHEFQILDAKKKPSADFRIGQWVVVQYQPMKVAVRTADGGRNCLDCNRFESIAPSQP
jgi:hypothetical protein